MQCRIMNVQIRWICNRTFVKRVSHPTALDLVAFDMVVLDLGNPGSPDVVETRKSLALDPCMRSAINVSSVWLLARVSIKSDR